MNFAGLPPHSSPEGMRRAGGTTELGARMDSVSMTDPSHSTERAPTMHLFSTRQDRNTAYGSMVTLSPISVAAFSPVGTALQ